MRKDELLYLHQLLALVRDDWEHRGVVSADAFAEYDALDVTPMAIYASKSEHQEAVAALAARLAARSEGDADEQAVASP